MKAHKLKFVQMLGILGVVGALSACNEESPFEVATASVPAAMLNLNVSIPNSGTLSLTNYSVFAKAEGGLVTTGAFTNSLRQISVTARSSADAPSGTFESILWSSSGERAQVTRYRRSAGAPWTRVEVWVEGKLQLVVRSEWTQHADSFLLTSRTYERWGADGSVTESKVAFDVSAHRAALGSSEFRFSNSVYSGKRVFLPVSSTATHEDDSTSDCLANPGLANGSVSAEESGGCGLKFAAVALTAAAASVAFGAGVSGFLATLASGGLLAPAEAGIVTAYFIAEAAFVTATDRWLDCINEVPV